MSAAVGAATLTALAALGACSAQQRASSARADLVLTNGRIYTGDPTQPYVEALAIRGDQIMAIGTDARIGELRATRRIDLGGRLVIPGINDAHVHQPSLLLASSVELPGEFDTLTMQQMSTTLAAASRELPPGTWLQVDLSAALLDDPALDRRLLDQLAPQHPVWVDNFAGHVLVLNTAAIQAAGIDPHAPPPRGGFIGRAGNGADDGWFYEYSRYAAMRAFGAQRSDRDVSAAIEDFESAAVELGVTSVQTFPNQLEPDRLVRVLRASPRRVRWHVMRLPVGDVIAPPRFEAASRDLVTFYGTKYFLEGTPVERGAAMREPYADLTAADGRPLHGRADWDPAAIRTMIDRACDSGDPLHLHISGDVQLGRVLDAMDARGSCHAHIVIEHGDAIAAADIPRIVRHGMVVVQNPAHAMPAQLNRARLGDRVDHWMAMRSLLAAGVHFALGSDGPPNPYLNMLFATQHPTNPREALTREQGLVAFTQGAAFDEQTDSFKGRLVPGMVADLAVLSQDLFTASDAQLPKTRSVLTIVGGRIVHDALTSPASARSSARTE